MNSFFTELEKQIEAATRKAFIEMVAQCHNEGETLYGFGLYSDDGAMTVCVATNTVEYLHENGEEDDMAYYKFSTNEWGYEGQGADEDFANICTLLRTNLEKNPDDQFQKFRDTLFDTCIKILIKLYNEGFFKNEFDEDIFLTFAATDFEFDNDKIKHIVTSLNNNHYKDEYLEWMKNWGA